MLRFSWWRRLLRDGFAYRTFALDEGWGWAAVSPSGRFTGYYHADSRRFDQPPTEFLLEHEWTEEG
jgi:hypothetical protein